MALTSLAGSDSSGFMPVEALARRANVPGPYLSKLIKILASKGIVVTRKGIKGGVKLANRSISFHDVCVALDEPALSSKDNFLEQGCEFAYPSQFETLWKSFRRDFLAGLKETKLLVACAPNRSPAMLTSNLPQPRNEAA